MKLNLPNRLTLLRMLCVPLVVLFLHLGGVFRMVALGLFLLASITDFCDGRIARKRDLVTDLGKFLDPLADKLLVLCTMITLLRQGQISLLLCIIVVIREISVDGLRMIAASKGKVIAAAKLGKYKTAAQMVLLVWVLAFGIGPANGLVTVLLSVIAGVLTVLSGVEYFIRNKDVFAN